MRAVLYRRFGELPSISEVPAPRCPEEGAVVRVRACGLCRSDWHAWMGHDPGVALPQVPGHELAGVVEQVGSSVRNFAPGDRVTAPFVNACGRCPTCREGKENLCPHQSQPGFTRWGAFAELVVVDFAEVNLVRLPDRLGFPTAASLACRLATAWRAVVRQGRAEGGQWCSVHGCGGAGLSAVMVAASRGMQVVAVDPSPSARATALSFGAAVALDPEGGPVAGQVRELTGGGAHLSVDALGRGATLADGLAGLRPGGRHVQVGLLLGGESYPRVDMGAVVARELEVLGSHGMAAREYPELLAEVTAGRLDPARLVARTVSLEEVPEALAAMGEGPGGATTVMRIGDGLREGEGAAPPQ